MYPEKTKLADQPPVVDPTKSANSARIAAPFHIATRQTRDRYLKFLVYGKPGAGKTELCGSAVDCNAMNDVLVVSAESGDIVYEDSPRIKNWAKLVDNTIYATDFMQVARVQEFLKAYCSARDRNDVATMRKLYKAVSVSDENPTGIELENPPQYRTVILDSLTEIEAYCQYQVLRVDTTKMLVEEGGMDVSGWPEFRRQYEMVKLLVRSYRDLPMHVLMTCAEQYTKDENSRFHYGPKMTGKLASEVQGFVDVAGWLTVGAATEDGRAAPRRLYIQPVGGSGPRFDAKNRRPVYGKAFMDNPSMTSMMSDLGLIKA